MKQPANAEISLKKEQLVIHLSKSMEKSFLALKNPKARAAYVEAELVNSLAHQIRIIRQQRGLSQRQLAEKLGTTQTTVSRLEDPSYGRYSMRSLLALSKVFDTAILVRFMPFSRFMPDTWDTHPKNFEALSYEDEAPLVHFYTENKNGAHIVLNESKSVALYESKNIFSESSQHLIESCYM
ncbi:helix-turn-helix transcriptional regulator [Candidatus Nitrotoga sp. M5]|uniref:helix-turn-helix transcriptional regulator n=1 Tax=Candidatus Nitrotoga sp. M5 TaxID=2890409 RepID=UPI001EF23545|nr:helix-turn-helix transcriptional regulator [Candidatus Nitrotoga sp. M5]